MNAYELLKLAFTFLTVLPARLNTAPAPGDLGRAAAWFPLVGGVVGAAAALALWGFGWVFPPLLAGLLALIVWVGLTGGLHLDGLADCCDGLFNASSPERRLEIMKDPRLGSFGGTGLVLALLLKLGGLLALTGLANTTQSILAVLLAAALGRWLILLAARQPTARPGGMGADFALGLRGRAFAAAAVVPLSLALLCGWRGLLAVTLAHLGVWWIFRLARSRLGGVTGDVFGLVVETGEILTLLAFAVRLPA
jgi:adenosylcobinamide-GDP ribazoletransferase